MLGSCNETMVWIENVEVPALLDTGANVSTVNEEFVREKLPHIEVQPMKELINVECADGQYLPYIGYICVNIHLPGMGLGPNVSYPCMMLVTPPSGTHKILLGTNFLEPLLAETRKIKGPKFLQDTSFTTPWYLAFRCLTIRDQELRRRNYKLGTVRSLQHTIVKPNSFAVIQSRVDKPVDHRPTLAIMQSDLNQDLNGLLDIADSVINYDFKGQGFIDVVVENVTTQAVVITPRTVLCSLQPAVSSASPTKENEEADYMDKIQVNTTRLTLDQQQRLKDLLKNRKDNFSTNPLDVGHHSRVKHEIPLHNPTPFKQPHRRIPPGMFEQIREHLQQMLDSGIIRRSHSPWSSNVVWVKKKDGSLRQCVDFRQLNSRSVKDSYALPRIEEILDCLSGSKFFSVLDLKQGYHQVEIREDHKERTAFTVAPLGFFEYNRMAMGLANAPATYQRLMEDCLGDLHLKICLVFLDDIIIFSDSFEEHVSRVEQVLDRLQLCGLKLNPKKCVFGQDKVRYVGHIVSEEGVEADPEKLDRVKDWPRPQTPEDVRRFIGFCGYYRRFVKSFSQLAKPLTDLMPPPTKKKKGRKLPVKQTSAKKWTWGEEQETAFQQLKEKLVTAPILAYADYDKPFELHTDASTSGLGAVLYQEQNGMKRVIAYGSRGLNKSERHYPAHKLEFLALKWAITEKFSDYLYGHQFSVFTDNNPLTYVLTSARLDATGHRWLAALSMYTFDIKYRPGQASADVDILSRLPQCQTPPESDDEESIPMDSVKAVCQQSQSYAYCEGFCNSTRVVQDSFEEKPQDFRRHSSAEIRQAQLEDPILGIWMKAFEKGKRPSIAGLSNPSAHRTLHQMWDQLKLHDGKLVREATVEGSVRQQLVLPYRYISEVLNSLHNEVGHQGRDRTLSLVRDRFVWPGMASDVENWVKQCRRCICRKALSSREPLVNIRTTQPLELVSMDFLSLETSRGGYQSILVITDHFTRFAQAIPTRNQTAKTTAEAFFKQFVVHYGMPMRIHSDMGANFESRIIKELCKISGTEKSRTTPYHPQGNGMTERFNRTLLGMLGTLERHQKQNWKDYVGTLVHAYNCTKHESTGYSPYSLMFGREPHLPIDRAFGLEKQQSEESLTKYVENLQKCLKESFDIATAAADKARRKQKLQYDLKVRPAEVKIGDRVLVKRLAFEGKSKLEDKWEEEVYVILDQPNPDIPVFLVQHEDGTGRKRSLHRNKLLPLGTRMSSPAPEATENVQSKRVRRSRRHKKIHHESNSSESTSRETTESESEEQILVVPTNNQVGNTVSNTGSGGDAHEESDSSEEDAPADPQPEDAVNENQLSTENHPQQSSAEEDSVDIVENEEGEENESHTSEPMVENFEPEPVPDSPETEVPATSTPIPAPRRRVGARNRQDPHWMRSGDYVLHSQQASSPSFFEKLYDNLKQDFATLKEMPESLVKMFLWEKYFSCK